MIDLFARKGTLVPKDVTPWQTFSGKGMKFRLQSFDWDGCACVSHLDMRAFFGLMRMNGGPAINTVRGILGNEAAETLFRRFLFGTEG